MYTVNVFIQQENDDGVMYEKVDLKKSYQTVTFSKSHSVISECGLTVGRRSRAAPQVGAAESRVA